MASSASGLGPLLRVVLIWAAIPLVTGWLPLLRGAMDGPSYEWGQSYFGLRFGGRGMGGDYWVLPLLAAVVLTMLWLGWRGGRRPFHWLLLAWAGLETANAIYNALAFPERYRFRGDTLGVDVSLAWTGPLFYGGLLALAFAWVMRDLRSGRTPQAPPWTGANTILLVIVLALFPIEFALLRPGPMQSTTDKIGVLLIMFQWALVNACFARQPRVSTP